jgi:putative endonuclease
MDTAWGRTKAKLAKVLAGKSTAAPPTSPASGKASHKAVGDAAETRALHWLQTRGLRLVQRNYRVALGPHARGGEIDLIMKAPDGTLVFVEVRQRQQRTQGGAAASVSASKQRSLVLAAQHFLRGLPALPPCRFDVVAIDGETIEWLQAAFDAT